jgi:hypothetical protein
MVESVGLNMHTMLPHGINFNCLLSKR